jgi:DNA-binding Lrp family transcriptional regulator
MRASPVTVGDVTHPSHAVAAKALGLSRSALSKRLREGRKADAPKRVKYVLGEAHGLAQVAALLGIAKSTASMRLRRASSRYGIAPLFKPVQPQRKAGEWAGLVKRAA